jgi:hypothetical protein
MHNPTRERLRERRQRAEANGCTDGPRGNNGYHEPWEQPIPFSDQQPPAFPVDRLPDWLAAWVNAEAEATQTPPDLAVALVLASTAAAIAGRYRVEIRPGWQEPVNLYTVTALLPGERKSAVFRDAIAPTLAHEKAEADRMAPKIAAAESEHRMMELELKSAESKAAKAKDAKPKPNTDEIARLRGEAKRLATELATYVVPDPPQLLCDDITSEKLAQLIVRQGGRMLLASAEGTAFEIAKGRYSETANFDVYLKAHAGDPLRSDRIGREREADDQPALTCALAVQPDVIQGLAQQTTMRGRGFLARWLYFMPASRVGSRKTAAKAVPEHARDDYAGNLRTLWELPGAIVDGKLAANVIVFSIDADTEMQNFERWLEPQLAEGEDLSHLAGWANKLAGAVARIAGVLHMASVFDRHEPISRETVQDAIAIGRDYLLPHAKIAFSMMGTDDTTDDAKVLWSCICRRVAHVAHVAHGGPRFSRRDCLNWNRRRFKKAEDLDPALQVLCDHNLIRYIPGSGEPGRGRKGPEYEANPTALDTARRNLAPQAQRAQGPQPDQHEHGDAWEGD